MQFEKKEQERKLARSAKSSEGGDKKLRPSRTTSVNSLQEQVEKNFVEINGVRLFLSSSSQELIDSAKQFLENHFSKESMPVPTSSKMKYSKSDFMTLASSPLAHKEPLRWDKLVKTIPSIILKSTSQAAGDGGVAPDMESKKTSLSLSVNLPVIRNLGN